MSAEANLARPIFFALIAGAALGVLSHALFPPDDTGPFAVLWHRWLIDGLLAVIAGIFIALLKMLIVPLVFVSLVCGVTGSGADVARLGRIGSTTFVLYLATTAAAIAIALTLATLIAPGAGVELGTATFTAPPAPAPIQVLIGLVPSNPFAAFAQGNLLQVIVFALLVGVAILKVGDRAAGLRGLFVEANAVVLMLTALVMRAAPLGVFALIARVFADSGVDIFAGLAWYVLTLLLALGTHLLLVYLPLLRLAAGIDPRIFFRRFREPMLVAFATASSAATLPVTLRTMATRFGVPTRISSFTLPLGATVNMDGTAIMQGVATCFIAQAYGVELALPGYLAIIATATLASIGTAAVPSAGFITLTIVLTQVGLPFEAIGILLAVDRVLDMARTLLNVTGDAVVTLVVTQREGELVLPPETEHSGAR